MLFRIKSFAVAEMLVALEERREKTRA